MRMRSEGSGHAASDARCPGLRQALRPQGTRFRGRDRHRRSRHAREAGSGVAEFREDRRRHRLRFRTRHQGGRAVLPDPQRTAVHRRGGHGDVVRPGRRHGDGAEADRASALARRPDRRDGAPTPFGPSRRDRRRQPGPMGAALQWRGWRGPALVCRVRLLLSRAGMSRPRRRPADRLVGQLRPDRRLRQGGRSLLHRHRRHGRNRGPAERRRLLPRPLEPRRLDSRRHRHGRGAGSFHTIEGNTDHGGSANGYEVAEQTRGYGSKDFVRL